MQKCLVIVPCGRLKVWDSEPGRGPTRAADAYIGGLFTVNRRYAHRFGDAWIVLSAKYGFVEPEFVIPEPYDTIFTRKRSHPVGLETLHQQVEILGLDRYESVIGLGGKAYREVVQEAFAPFGIQPVFPFAGMPIGRMLQATVRAIEADDPDIEWQVLP